MKRRERKRGREMAAVFLSMSGSCPVNIHINTDGRSLPRRDVLEQAGDFLDLLNSHMGHCSQLCIEHTPRATMTMLFNRFSRQPTSLLRAIRLSNEPFNPLPFY